MFWGLIIGRLNEEAGKSNELANKECSLKQEKMDEFSQEEILIQISLFKALLLNCSLNEIDGT